MIETIIELIKEYAYYILVGISALGTVITTTIKTFKTKTKRIEIIKKKLSKLLIKLDKLKKKAKITTTTRIEEEAKNEN